MQCPVVSVGPVCVWAALLALAVLDTSISTAASKWPSQHISTVASPQLSPGSLLCFCSPVPPCTASQSLLGRGLCGFFLGSPTVPSVSWRLLWASLSPRNSPPVLWAHVHLSKLHSPSLCITGLVCACLSSTGPSSSSRGLCALVWAPRAPSSASRGLCALASAPGARPLLHGACVCLSGLPGLTLGIAGLVCACLGSPGSLSASRDLCALVSAHWAHPVYHRVQFLQLLLLLSRFSRVRLCATPEMAAHQAPLSLGFSRQEHWSGLPFPPLMHESEKGK